jgi:hypothetical protein
MATEEKEKMYPVINDVRTLQAPGHGIAHQGEMSTVVYSAPTVRFTQTNNSTSQADYPGQTSLKDEQKIPQRPQDLLDNISLDLARTNVKSCAQYRKSYAFKIWRDKGCFPYRLAKQPVVKEVVQRKKSKKFLNAARAQRDREKEEEWKAFKSGKNTNNEMKYRRLPAKFPRIRVEENVAKDDEKQELNILFSDTLKGNGPIPSNHARYQNSIPDYFKNKKESAQKSQPLVSPTKSIPTSVIHVNTTKVCHVSKQTTQAEISSEITFDKGTSNVSKSLAMGLLKSIPYSKGNLIQEQGGENKGAFFSYDTLTSSVGSCNIHVQSQEQLNTTTVIDRENITTETVAAGSPGPSEGRNSSDIQCKQQDYSSVTPHNSRSLSTTSDMSADRSAKRREEFLSTECNGKVVSNQSSSSSPMEETSSEVENPNLSLIIKNSLSKKYSKENVKPNTSTGAVDRGRKRARNESIAMSSEEGERQRARIKQHKATVFTRLDEAVATNLADGIHNVNSEYFPIEALANKAAKETSKNVPEGTESKCQPNTSINYKVAEIERAR